MNKKILITGGCGFIGSNLAIFLKDRKFEVDTLDNFSRDGSELNLKNLKKKNIKNYKIDIFNKKKILRLPKYDFIIDCCADPAIDSFVKDSQRVLNTNLIGTYNILEKCSIDKSNLIFLSTSRVYSLNKIKNKIKKNKILKKLKLNKSHTISESFPTDSPISFYGFTKLSSENLIKEYSFFSKIKYINNRFGVVSGPWQFGKVEQGFLSLWVWKHIVNGKLTYKGYGANGYQVRDILHIKDLCFIIKKQISNFNKINCKTFNIGGGLKNIIDLKTLTEKCYYLTKNKIEIFKDLKTSKLDIPFFVSNNTRVMKYYKWKPKFKINSIIKDVYNWQIKNFKILKKYMK